MLKRGVMVATLIAVTAAMTSAAAAQDRLKSIVTKQKLTVDDVARIQAEVATRARKLAEAGKDPRRRKATRDRLIGTSRIPKATRVGLDAYAQACDEELSPLVMDDDLNVALDAILVLEALDNAKTADALAQALSSPHEAVRYKAARGLELLHKEIAKQADACRTVLAALGRAGAVEKSEPVLRMIYRALHFSADVPNFRYAHECAAALNAVYAGRLRRLRQGSRDEWKDAPSLAIAADCYANATADQQRELVKHLAAFLAHDVDRYCDNSTAEEYYPTIAGLVADVEKILRRMIRDAGATPPSDRVSAHVKPSRPDARMKRDARAAVKSLKAVLAKPPWNL